MKVGVLDGRTVLVVGDRAVDVEAASGGAVPASPASVLAVWADLLRLSEQVGDADGSGSAPLDPARLERPVPVPLQAFGIGVNYLDHAGESAMDLPRNPLVFPKFSSSITGPNDEVVVRTEALDWEAELVVVIGSECFEVAEGDVLAVVAGYTIGQDLSDRVVQFEGGANPQFGLGKSGPGFGPIGPWVVSADEIGAEPHLAIRCEVDGVTKQSSDTEHLIFGVPALVSYLSSRVRLHPGDLIFTGTPAGVGWSRDPRETLHAGSRIETTIDGIGTLTTRFVAP
ncbi:fumarylacetoacetate hydrolase family protein [uncultured Amnibacterium sp.]|uniref:fumarylacetoacetate hydrolase family protein n=1 Tax=uncultured Amnibacterium sp. TaxID=1631851 RepID=UPI0035C9BEF9